MKCNCTCNCPDGNREPVQYSGGNIGGAPDCPSSNPWSMSLTITNNTDTIVYLDQQENASVKPGETKVFDKAHNNEYGNHTTLAPSWGGVAAGKLIGSVGIITFSNGGGVAIAPGGPGNAITASGTWASGTHPSQINFSTTGTTQWQSPSDPEHNSCQYTVNITFSGKFPPKPPAYQSGTTIVNNLSGVNVNVASSGQTVPPVAPGQSWHGDNANTVTATVQTKKGISQGALSVTSTNGVVFTMTAATGNDVEIKVTATPTGGKAVTQTFSTPSAAPVTILPLASWPGGVVELDFNPKTSFGNSGTIQGTNTQSFC